MKAGRLALGTLVKTKGAVGLLAGTVALGSGVCATVAADHGVLGREAQTWVQGCKGNRTADGHGHGIGSCVSGLVRGHGRTQHDQRDKSLENPWKAG